MGRPARARAMRRAAPAHARATQPSAHESLLSVRIRDQAQRGEPTSGACALGLLSLGLLFLPFRDGCAASCSSGEG
jgi:hypothetical protein